MIFQQTLGIHKNELKEYNTKIIHLSTFVTTKKYTLVVR